MDQVRAGRRLGAILAALLSALPAAAQTSGGQRGQQPPASSTRKPTAAVPEPWPRLDPGALLCRSRDDLVAYQKQVASGTTVVAAQQATGCHSIRKPTAVQILDRDGPSRTQVVTSDSAKESGWTNTYLPDEKPGQ